MQYSTAAFEKEYTYEGNDLGATWSPEETVFKVWAPTAEWMQILLYPTGDPKNREVLQTLPMEKGEQGVWTARASGDLNGIYYTCHARVERETVEVCDPYAKAVGINGHRAMVIDLASTNPVGWEQDRDPNGGKSITQAVICELHLRDLSMDPQSGMEHKGKYLALTEKGTHTPGGKSTGLDYFCDLGITHLQLLPVYDYGSVDEATPDREQYNWGYDPVNYNVPEGSYATDPYRGEVRIREFKEMIKAIHDRGISVVMDVVYNHVYHRDSFCFNRLVPGYFSRINERDEYSNGSGCGNDTASERSMVRKYIVDSVKYWADEYHIDGFRFDLAGLLDVQTIRQTMDAVHKNHPNVLFYGEGWHMGTTLTRQNVPLCNQGNAQLVPGFAFFNDTLRDGLRGSVFAADAPGYVSGNGEQTGAVADCFRGGAFWCPHPTQTINYVSCHDNLTLFDKLTASSPGAYREQLIARNKLAAAVVMLSQGVPFFQAGEEFLRTKRDARGMVDNSYASPDSVNRIQWGLLDQPEHAQVRDYYRGLIALRKSSPDWQMNEASQVERSIFPIEGLGDRVLGFWIRGREEWCVVLNPTNRAVMLELPRGNWEVVVDERAAGTAPLGVFTQTAQAAPISAMVLRKQ